MLASCGLCYDAESDEDACICQECQGYVTMEELEAANAFSHDKLLSYHTYDCLLADTLQDLIRQRHHIGILASSLLTAPTTTSQSPLLHATSNPPQASQEEKPSENAAAAPLPTPKIAPTHPSPPSSPPLVSPTRPSYATIASLPLPTSSSTPSKNPRLSNSITSTHRNTPATPITTPRAPKATPQSLRPQQTSSPVLSIYNLERRFHNRPNLLSNPQRHLSPQNPPTTAIARLLHAIADLFECHDPSHAFNTRNLYHSN